MTIDASLTPAQQRTNLLITRMLDDLYWVMSYSRWKDDPYCEAFRGAVCRSCVSIHSLDKQKSLAKAKASYDWRALLLWGIGGSTLNAGIIKTRASLILLRCLFASHPFARLFSWETPTSIDVVVYGFMANIYFYDIDTHR